MAANTTNNTPKPDEDDMRADLQAMLAASRELGPDMDRSLVDSYLERQRGAMSGGAGNGAPAIVPNQGQSGQPQPFGQLANLAGMGMLTAAYIAALIVSGGHLWWLIFVLMGVFGGFWGWWGHDEQERERHLERHAARDDYRLRRREMRYDYRARRRGYYLPEDNDRSDDSRSDDSRDRRSSTSTNSYD